MPTEGMKQTRKRNLDYAKQCSTKLRPLGDLFKRMRDKLAKTY